MSMTSMIGSLFGDRAGKTRRTRKRDLGLERLDRRAMLAATSGDFTVTLNFNPDPDSLAASGSELYVAPPREWTGGKGGFPIPPVGGDQWTIPAPAPAPAPAPKSYIIAPEDWGPIDYDVPGPDDGYYA